MILLIDNYDSFVHNLARYFQRLGQVTQVVRNDAITVDEVSELRPSAIVISPGPCDPTSAGISLAVVARLHATFPMLGICLGHQTIGAAFGGEVVRAAEPRHGRTSAVYHDGMGLFQSLPQPFTACRYHSLVVASKPWPAPLVPTAWTRDGQVMALRHRDFPVYGVQFHPESILTEGGFQILGNFLRLIGLPVTGEDQAFTQELSLPPAVEPSSWTRPITF